MIPVLVLTHGELAEELLKAAQTIDPSLVDQTSAMSLPCRRMPETTLFW